MAGLTALVTGAGSGLGRGIAQAYAEEGARVWCADINEAAVSATARSVSGTAITVDVTDADSCERAVAEAGELDVLVNAAGITTPGSAAELDLKDWYRTLDVNLTGTLLMVRAAWPALQCSERPSIVNIASAAAFHGMPANIAYCASKAAVVNMTKCLALDGASDGIRANSISPSAVETPLLTEFFDRSDNPALARAEFSRTIPLGRIGSIRDVQMAAVYLGSTESEWVTGTSLVVDGGMLAK